MKENYKWSWTLDQRAIIESGLDIDDRDFSILKMLSDFATSKKCKKMQEGGSIYYYFHWTLIRDQLPILRIKTRQGVAKRIGKLVEAKLLSPHPENQKNKDSYFEFGPNKDSLFSKQCKRKLPSVNESYPNQEETTQNSPKQCKRKLPSVNESYQESKQEFTLSDNESLHNKSNNNKEDNIKEDIFTFPLKIGKISTNLPSSFPTEVSTAIIEFLKYRQSLPAKDRIKTQKGWDMKISSFSKMLEGYSATQVVGAINLSIESEWKNVKMDWYLKNTEEAKKNKSSFNNQDELTPLARWIEDNFTHQTAKAKLAEYWKAKKGVFTDTIISWGKASPKKGLKLFYIQNPQLQEHEA